MSFKYVEDPILGKGRAEFDNGGGSGGEDLIAGYRTVIAGGTTSFNPVADIVNVTGTSVTLEPDKAYRIYATTSAVTLNATPPDVGKWGYDGHIELFVAGTGYVQTGDNVVLATALEPDSVNNCTVRFHDGIAIIAVEDHVAGYIVVNGSTSGEGSLAYGIDTSTNEYIAFDATLNGTPIDLSGSTANGEKHIVGNGYTETTLTGAVDCGISKFTVANLSLQNVGITGGTMTLGDAYIPSGSTVHVIQDRVTFENVRGEGPASVFDLDTSHITPASGIARASSCTFTNGSSTQDGGGFVINSGVSLLLSDVLVSGNAANRYAGGFVINQGGTVFLTGSTVAGNTAESDSKAADIRINNGTLDAYNSFIGACGTNVGGTINLGGTIRVGAIDKITGTAPTCVVTISAGAVIDLTGNTNATPINPGGGITFAPGGATVQLGATAGTVDSSYMMDNVTLPAGAKLTNTAAIDLGGKQIVVPNDAAINITGATFTNGVGTSGGAFNISSGATANFTDVKITGNTATNRGGGVMLLSCTANFSNCVVSGNTAPTNATKDFRADNTTLVFNGDCTIGYVNVSGATVVVTGNNSFVTITGASTEVTISSGATINLTSGIEPGGSIQVVGGTCTVNGHTIVESTYTSISSDGTTVPPQPEPAEE